MFRNHFGLCLASLPCLPGLGAPDSDAQLYIKLPIYRHRAALLVFSAQDSVSLIENITSKAALWRWIGSFICMIERCCLILGHRVLASKAERPNTTQNGCETLVFFRCWLLFQQK